MSLAYLSGFAKWEGVEVLPFRFFFRSLRVRGVGGKLSLPTAPTLGQGENDSPVFLERCFLDPTDPLWCP